MQVFAPSVKDCLDKYLIEEREVKSNIQHTYIHTVNKHAVDTPDNVLDYPNCCNKRVNY
jgi:hypothetical protein